jgi:pimeloyl-ACP methyl ester carboxylesterase
MTVLFIHGAGAALNTWDYNIEAFAKQFRVLALDLPGFGNSDKPDIPYSLDLFADFINKFMEAKNVDKAVLVGNSMGGEIAILVSLKYPDKVHQLVLVDSTGADNYLNMSVLLISKYDNFLGRNVIKAATSLAPKSRFIYDRMMWKFFERDGKNDYPSAFFYDVHSYPTEEYVRGEIDYLYDFIASPEYPKYMTALGRSLDSLRNSDTYEKIKEIKVPTLLVWGHEDGIVPIHNAFTFNNEITPSWMTLFPNCCHLPMLESPDRFNKEVIGFIR